MGEELSLKRLLIPEGQAHFQRLYAARGFSKIATFIGNIEPDIKIPLVQEAISLSQQFRMGSEHAQAIHFLSNHARFALTKLQPSASASPHPRHHDENFPVWPLAALQAFYSNVENFEQRYAEGKSHQTPEGNPQLTFVPAPIVEAAFCQQHNLQQDFTANPRHNLLAHILPRNGISDKEKEEVFGAVYYALHDTFPRDGKGFNSGVVINIADAIVQAAQVEQQELKPRNLLTADYQRPADQEFLKTWVKAIGDACYWQGALGNNYNARLMNKEGNDVLLVPLDPQKYPQDNQLLAVIAQETASKSFIK